MLAAAPRRFAQGQLLQKHETLRLARRRLRLPTCTIHTRTFLAAGTILLLQHEQLAAQLHQLLVCGTQGRCRRFRFVERVHFRAIGVPKSKAAGVLHIEYSTLRTVGTPAFVELRLEIQAYGGY